MNPRPTHYESENYRSGGAGKCQIVSIHKGTAFSLSVTVQPMTPCLVVRMVVRPPLRRSSRALQSRASEDEVAKPHSFRGLCDLVTGARVPGDAREAGPQSAPGGRHCRRRAALRSLRSLMQRGSRHPAPEPGRSVGGDGLRGPRSPRSGHLVDRGWSERRPVCSPESTTSATRPCCRSGRSRRRYRGAGAFAAQTRAVPCRRFGVRSVGARRVAAPRPVDGGSSRDVRIADAWHVSLQSSGWG